MYSNFIEEAVRFNRLSVAERFEYIKSNLLTMGIAPQEQTFYSCFGEGHNLFAEIGKNSEKVVLSAHYDGESIFDNNAGVLSLLGMSQTILSSNFPVSVILLCVP
jgi:hypothetical protein